MGRSMTGERLILKATNRGETTMVVFKVSKTYETWDEAAVEAGDTDDRGFEYEDVEMSLREVVRECESIGSWEPSSSPFALYSGQTSISLYAVDSDTNYRTGEETQHALHIAGSPRAIRRLWTVLSAERGGR